MITKTFYELEDAAGEIWASGEFTKTSLNKILNAYKRAGILLNIRTLKAVA